MFWVCLGAPLSCVHLCLTVLVNTCTGKLEEGVKSKYHIVGPIRGGFTHQIQRLLVFGEDGLFHLPTKP
jgi:hypothetical protein